MERSDPFVDFDAAYVMGALDPGDRRAFEAHLRTCDRCSAAVSELAGMPGLLAHLDTEQVLAPRVTLEPPPETLLPRMALALKRRQRVRRVSGAVGALAAACLVAGVVLGSGVVSNDKPAGTPIAMQLVSKVAVNANVRLNPVLWGTSMSLECTYKGEGPPGSAGQDPRVYRLVVVPKNGGAVQQVAQWTAVPGETAKLNGSTDLKPNEIADIRLINSKGTTLLHVNPPQA